MMLDWAMISWVITPKALKKKKKKISWTLSKYKNFIHQRTLTEWKDNLQLGENICKAYIKRDLNPGYVKNSYSSTENTHTQTHAQTQFKNEQKIWVDTSPKELM